MSIATLLTQALPIVLGAIIGFVPTYLLERRRERAQLRTRWDSPLFGLCSDFTSSARRLTELCARIDKNAAADDEQSTDELDEEHERLRRLFEQLRLLGSLDVQVAARWVLRHAWAVRELAEGREDPRAKEFPGLSPAQRLDSALDTLYVAARGQLRVPKAEQIAPREPLAPELEPPKRRFRRRRQAGL